MVIILSNMLFILTVLKLDLKRRKRSRVGVQRLTNETIGASYLLNRVYYRHGRAEHLICDSIELNEMQYFLFDVILILNVPLGLMAWMCYLFVATITSKLL